VKRPIQHEIDTLAQRILDGKLPGNIVLRSQDNKNDYGIDGEVELFQNNESTGTIFKIQIKGQEAPKYNSDKSVISFSLEIPNATYLIEQVNIPSALVVVDITEGNPYWVSLHTNKMLLEDYKTAMSKNQKSFTIHLPTKNLIPDSLEMLFEEMKRSAQFIALKLGPNIGQSTFADHLQYLEAIDPEIVHLQQKIDVAKSEQLSRHMKNKRLSEASILVNEILANSSSTRELKYIAALQLEDIEQKNVKDSEIGFYGKVEFDLNLASILRNIAGDDDRLALHAEGYKIAAELAVLVNDDFNYSINYRMNEKSIDSRGKPLEPFLFLSLPSLIMQSTNSIYAKLEVIAKYFDKLVKKRHFELIPSALEKIVPKLSIFNYRLKIDGLIEPAVEIDKWVHSLISFTSEIALSFTDKAAMNTALVDIFLSSHRFIYRDEVDLTNNVFIDECTKVLQFITDESHRSKCEDLLKSATNISTPDRETDLSKPDWDMIKHHIRTQATALGIDLRLAQPNQQIPNMEDVDEDVIIANIIQQGIEDLNPTEKLKSCVHMVHEYWGGIGVPAKMLGLYSASMKHIVCTLHPEHNSIITRRFVDSYEPFREEYCATCSDCCPHEDDWIFNEPWHMEMYKKYKDAVEIMRSKQSK